MSMPWTLDTARGRGAAPLEGERVADLEARWQRIETLVDGWKTLKQTSGELAAFIASSVADSFPYGVEPMVAWLAQPELDAMRDADDAGEGASWLGDLTRMDPLLGLRIALGAALLESVDPLSPEWEVERQLVRARRAVA